jgi:hypothetical protein
MNSPIIQKLIIFSRPLGVRLWSRLFPISLHQIQDGGALGGGGFPLLQRVHLSDFQVTFVTVLVGVFHSKLFKEK